MNLVWDFGGVLLGWHPPSLLRRTLPARADQAEHWARQIFLFEDGEWLEYDRGTAELPDVVARIAARTGLPLQEVQAVVDGVPGELQPIQQSVALLARLRAQGRRQFFLSNMPAPMADRLEAAHDFIGWFEAGVFSGRVRLLKPERAIFDLAAKRFGVEPSQLLFFDDHAANVEAARAAGWQAERFTSAAEAAVILQDRGLLEH